MDKMGWPGCREAISEKLSKQCQNSQIILTSEMKFSQINTREIHPAHWTISLSQPGFHITAPSFERHH
jgi:hypothetical protein